MTSAVSASRPRVRFPGNGPRALATELKERVGAYFEERGLSDKANATMVVRTVVMLTFTFGAYALILTNRFSPLAMLALAVLVGVGVAGLGFGVAHDAAHGAYSSRPQVNRTLAYTFDLLGASSYMWALGHNIVHHTYTNIPGVDGDIASSGLLRQSPGRAPRWYHRYQHLYAFPLYSLAMLNWVLVKDYKELLQSVREPQRERPPTRSTIALLFGFKAVHYGWSFVIPLLVLEIPWWQFLIGFVAMHLTSGLILGSVFPLAHMVEGPSFPTPDENGTMNDAWIAHELATTADFAHGPAAAHLVHRQPQLPDRAPPVPADLQRALSRHPGDRAGRGPAPRLALSLQPHVPRGPPLTLAHAQAAGCRTMILVTSPDAIILMA